MVKKKAIIIAASAVLGAAVVTGAAIMVPKWVEGSYKLTDFIVNTSGVTLTYEVGDDVSLSGLAMSATFSDDSTETVNFADVKFYLGDEDITSNLSKITESKGQKKVKIVYETKYGTDSVEITITVTDQAVELPAIEAFSKPSFVAEYETKLAAATNDAADAEFEQKFFKNMGVEYYVVGDDNGFKFLPVAETFNETSLEMETLERFTADSTVKMLVEDEYVTLTKSLKANSSYVYEYFNGQTLVLTEDAANNTFDFEENAIGSVFKLSVKPDAAVYEYDSELTAVEFPVKIVDGFNVYTAGQLSVLDNNPQRTMWDQIKGANGVAGVTTNGVILHQNTIITSADIPSALQYTLPDNYNVKYKDTATDAVGTPEDFGLTRTFIYNQMTNEGNPIIYDRYVAAGQTFNFYGNYFDFDTSKLPLVAPFHPTHMDKDSTWYGNDFSNTCLLMINGVEGTSGAADESFAFYNLAMKGNAKAEQLVVEQSTTGFQKDSLVYGGGLIFTKVEELKAQYDNARAYNYFISLFANPNTEVTYNRTKVYDSFQDAVYVWGKSNVTIANSYFQRAGGPLILMNHVDPDDANPEERIPTVTIDDNSVMEAYLAGTEVWFETVGGGTVIDQLRALDQIFNGMNKTIFVGKNANSGGKMNIVALLMRDGTSASATLGAISTQGSVSYKDGLLDRMNTTATGAQVHGIMNAVATAGGTQQPPIFSVGGSVYYYNGTTILTLTGSDGSAEMYGKMQTANYLGFYMGGLSLMFELGAFSAA